MTDELKRFFEALTNDQTLSEGLKGKIEGLDKDAATEVVVSYAREKGYNIDVEDLDAAKQDLDDDELAAVVGGTFNLCFLDGAGTRVIIGPEE